MWRVSLRRLKPETSVPKRVLIVEDNFDNREIYAELLRHAGYVTLEAENGLRGIEKAREHLAEIADAKNLPQSLYSKARALDHVYSLRQPQQPAQGEAADRDRW